MMGLLLALMVSPNLLADEPSPPTADAIDIDVAGPALRLFQQHCYGCHAEGAAEGKFAIDELLAAQDSEETRNRWWTVLKNVRSEMMPPKSEVRLDPGAKQELLSWLRQDALHIEAEHSDPGQVTLRRLNRTEYRNTIRDLMGVEFASEVEFPPDDTGHGFDTVGDAMSVSALLMEKYLQAAEEIVFRAVPTKSRVPREIVIDAKQLKDDERQKDAKSISFYEAADLSSKFSVSDAAEYEIFFEWSIDGSFDFDLGRCEVTVMLDDTDLLRREHGWHSGMRSSDRFAVQLEPGEHWLRLVLKPLVDASQKKADISFEVDAFRVVGPTDKSLWVAPAGYASFFPRPDPPEELAEQEEYAREVLRAFTTRAFRRPVDERTLDKLTAIANSELAAGNQTFEQSVARAMIAVLASPRFLFRPEEPLPADAGLAFPRLDEYALASRLSYFLWSTMPDERLFGLASEGKLRDELGAEVARLIADERFQSVSKSFVGQWLQTRDVETISIDPLEAIGAKEESDKIREELRDVFGSRRSEYGRDDHPPEIQKKVDRYRELRELRDVLTGDLRRDLRRETEEQFHYIASEDRSLLELLDAPYSFLNQRLAEYYGIEGVTGNDLRRVELPADSPRGGVLTQGSFLMVTSNPTRTSPVKRGLFILENFLGTPTPPPPAAVPELEEASKSFSDHKPTLREVLELHRKDALCASCHERFDPLGLAFENFNALGMWRDEDSGKPVQPAGELITGEPFENTDQLKHILTHERRGDFYRCFASKLMTYAIGRGPEYHDEEALEQIVAALERSDGRFSVAVLGVIESTPFQRIRAK